MLLLQGIILLYKDNMIGDEGIISLSKNIYDIKKVSILGLNRIY